MPTYRTQAAGAAPKKRRRYPKRLPRDPRKLFRWAARGSDADYQKLRALARKARRSLPAHINRDAYERSMRMPLGGDWNAVQVLKKNIAPRVLVPRGVMVKPIAMTRDRILEQHKKRRGLYAEKAAGAGS